MGRQLRLLWSVRGLATLLAACPSTLAWSQTGWQPTRLPASTARHISTSGNASQGVNHSAQQSWTQSQPGSAAVSPRPQDLFEQDAQRNAEAERPAVVLRWKTRKPTPPIALQRESQKQVAAHPMPAAAAQQAFEGNAHQAFAQSRPDSVVGYTPGSSAQPAPAVHRAAYQQELPPLPFGSDRTAPAPTQSPRLPPAEAAPTPQLPPVPSDAVPQQERLPSLEPFEAPSPESVAPLPPDALQGAEAAPPPDSVQHEAQPGANPFRQDDSPRLSPSDQESARPQEIPDNRYEQGFELPDRDIDFSSISCNELRSRVRNRPLTDVQLDVSPAYGRGLRPEQETEVEQSRLEFAATSPIRSWRDVTNRVVAVGRLVDLRDDRVILDVDGRHQAIPVLDLSDADVAYVGDAWNIPIQCGVGNESFTGRQFIASTVQWTAPGHCHKPLYFQQPQLERYGHEIGPVLQPMVSTAHFFGNILVLPYKMGIHPPNECQYSLGYFRPGNCAPYMVQPVPISLRGAAAQAAAVTGAAALIP